jgi:hypothetical protein
MIQRLPQLPRLRVGMPCGPASPPSFYQRLLCGFGGDISKDGWVLSPGLPTTVRAGVFRPACVLMEHRWHHHRLVFFKQSFGSPKILIIAAPIRYTFGYKHQFGLSTLNVAQPLIIGRLRHLNTTLNCAYLSQNYGILGKFKICRSSDRGWFDALPAPVFKGFLPFRFPSQLHIKLRFMPLRPSVNG